MIALNLKPNRLFSQTKLYYNPMKTERDVLELKPAIDFYLPDSGHVSLVITDCDGRRVITLIDNEFLRKGFYHKELDYRGLPKGNYRYELSAGDESQQKEIMIK
jgi:hypothetical protein